MKSYINLLLIICLLVLSCSPAKVDYEAAKSEVKQSINEFFQSYFDKDLERLSEFLAKDVNIVFIGTAESDFITDRDTLIKAYQKQIQTLEFTNVEIVKEIINISPSGKIAWIARVNNVDAKIAEESFRINNLRWTAVLQKINGKWVFVQSHDSLPVKN